MIYVVITLMVLTFLNYYCSSISQRLFYQSKEVSMTEKVQLVASTVGELDVLNPSSVTEAVESMKDLRVTRLIVTDENGGLLFDSLSEGTDTGKFYLYPEIVQALQGNDVFTWHYHDGIIRSQSATPILSYSDLTGCVYMMEYDAEQGELIRSLQINILTTTAVMEILLVLFTLIYSNVFNDRLNRIMDSIRTIRAGDYSAKVQMGGQDELTILAKEFNELTDRLAEAQVVQRRFVSDASHELKTPLASIKLLSDSILQNDMDQETVREFVSDIGQEADRLNRMSWKLLSLTRTESTESECEIVYMTPTIDRVVRMLSTIAGNTGITIHRDYAQDCSILIQEDDLYEIVFNLVENGIKYNVPGGSLTIRLYRQEDNAVLHICDTGVGIPENAIGSIFDRFYRVDKARSRQSGGSGLGLAIVRDMVIRNRGTISVESRTGAESGSTFTLTFPIFDVEDIIGEDTV